MLCPHSISKLHLNNGSNLRVIRNYHILVRRNSGYVQAKMSLSLVFYCCVVFCCIFGYNYEDIPPFKTVVFIYV